MICLPPRGQAKLLGFIVLGPTDTDAGLRRHFGIDPSHGSSRSFRLLAFVAC